MLNFFFTYTCPPSSQGYSEWLIQNTKSAHIAPLCRIVILYPWELRKFLLNLIFGYFHDRDQNYSKLVAVISQNSDRGANHSLCDNS